MFRHKMLNEVLKASDETAESPYKEHQNKKQKNEK